MPSAVHRILAAVTAAMLLVTLGISAQVHGRWLTTRFAPLPQPAEEYWSAAANGKMYVLGGSATNIGGRSVLPGRVLEYDPATDKWTARKQMPHPADHMAVAEYHGKIYVFGGTGPQHPTDGGPNTFLLDKGWEYDPVPDSWKALAPIPTGRHAAGRDRGEGLPRIGNGVVFPALVEQKGVRAAVGGMLWSSAAEYVDLTVVFGDRHVVRRMRHLLS